MSDSGGQTGGRTRRRILVVRGFSESALHAREMVQWTWADHERPSLRTVQRKLMEDDLVALANDDSMKNKTKIPRT